MDEAHYDIPWEYVCKRPQLLQRPASVRIRRNSDSREFPKKSPFCDVPAKTRPNNDLKIWQKPDPLPSLTECTYKVKLNKNPNLKSSGDIYSRIWEANSGQSKDLEINPKFDGQKFSDRNLNDRCVSTQKPAISHRYSPLETTVFCSKALSKYPVLKTASELKNQAIQQICNGKSHSNLFASRNNSRHEPCHPMDILSSSETVRAATEKPSLNCALSRRIPNETNQTIASSVQDNAYDVPWEYRNGRKLQNAANSSSTTVPVPLMDRKKLSLGFGCSALNPDSEKININLPLDRQTWFHGNISRAEAEKRLTNQREGSFMVRMCEKSRNEYALSLKSAKGYMHMKIQLNNGRKWILGYFGRPFDTVPFMLLYYSKNKLPIKGAEHMCLLFPVTDNLL